MGFSEEMIDNGIEDFNDGLDQIGEGRKEKGSMVGINHGKVKAEFGLVKIATGVAVSPINGSWHLGKKVVNAIKRLKED